MRSIVAVPACLAQEMVGTVVLKRTRLGADRESSSDSSEIATGCRTAIGATLRAARYLISDGPNAIGEVGGGINRRASRP